ADALVGHLALAHPHRQAAAADHHAVHHHAAGGHPALEHVAEILHHAAGHLVVTDAVDLHPTLALLELHGAARHHHPVGRHGRAGHAGLTRARHGAHSHPLHHHARHRSHSFNVGLHATGLVSITPAPKADDTAGAAPRT